MKDIYLSHGFDRGVFLLKCLPEIFPAEENKRDMIVEVVKLVCKLRWDGKEKYCICVE
jgi:hypothetical protein